MAPTQATLLKAVALAELARDDGEGLLALLSAETSPMDRAHLMGAPAYQLHWIDQGVPETVRHVMAEARLEALGIPPEN